jgi:hypothetical protein
MVAVNFQWFAGNPKKIEECDRICHTTMVRKASMTDTTTFNMGIGE